LSIAYNLEGKVEFPGEGIDSDNNTSGNQTTTKPTRNCTKPAYLNNYV